MFILILPIFKGLEIAIFNKKCPGFHDRGNADTNVSLRQAPASSQFSN